MSKLVKAHTIIKKWESLEGTPAVKKRQFVDYLTQLGFSTNDNLSGTYKSVYVHPEIDFVVKISKKGLGNALPRSKKVADLILQPIYNSKYIMVQPKAQVDSSSSISAFLSLQYKIKERNLTEFFENRDFSDNNCGMFEGKPVIFDISYFPGYTTEND